MPNSVIAVITTAAANRRTRAAALMGALCAPGAFAPIRKTEPFIVVLFFPPGPNPI
ncbi:MAG: hypothetical protein IPJ15_12990 [Actinomycetales bacterium]|nr:hypothetical protein [Candidatus Phosphoribacter baldrii]